MKVRELIQLLLEHDLEDELIITHPDLDVAPPTTKVYNIYEGFLDEQCTFRTSRRDILPRHTKALIVDIGDGL